MAAGDKAVGGAGSLIEGFGAGEFGGAGGDADDVLREDGLIFSGGRIPAAGQGVAADFVGGKVWPVVVHAEGEGAVGRVVIGANMGAGGEHGGKFFGAAGGGGGEEGGGAVAGVGAIGEADGFGGTVHVIGAGGPVDVEVDVAGGDVASVVEGEI